MSQIYDIIFNCRNFTTYFSLLFSYIIGCEISKIRYLPRNANNIVVPGNEYEVFYWDNEWVSLGRQEAKSHELTYTQAPSNALYFIRCHTEGKEERIFTYENREQIWW